MSSTRFDVLIQSQITKYKSNKYINRLSSFITQFLNDENIEINSLKGVIPCGGGYKITSIKSLITKLFTETQLNEQISPEESVSYGCGIEVKIQKYNYNINKLLSLPCLSKSIYLDGKGSKILLFGKKTPIPTMKEIVYI